MSDAPDKDARTATEQSDGAAVLYGLDDKELLDLINRLRLLAARKYYGSLDIDDLVMRAVSDTFEGIRTWNANCSPFRNLWFIVRSIASNQLKRDGRIPTCELDAEVTSDQTRPSTSAYPSPTEIHKTAESQRDMNALIRRAIGNDGLLRKAVAVFFKRGVWKPKAMAVELGVSVQEIYEAKRRMRRRLRKLLKKS